MRVVYFQKPNSLYGSISTSRLVSTHRVDGGFIDDNVDDHGGSRPVPVRCSFPSPFHFAHSRAHQAYLFFVLLVFLCICTFFFALVFVCVHAAFVTVDCPCTCTSSRPLSNSNSSQTTLPQCALSCPKHPILQLTIQTLRWVRWPLIS